AGSDMVFRVSLSDDARGRYGFELLDVLDHAKADKEDNIRLDFDFRAQDSDGDHVDGTFRVVVDDDGPVAGDAEQRTLHENDLPDGTSSGGTLLSSGDLHISWGADDA